MEKGKKSVHDTQGYSHKSANTEKYMADDFDLLGEHAKNRDAVHFEEVL